MLKKHILKLTAALLLVLCLSGCGNDTPPETTEPPTVYHKVTFMLNGMVYSEQQVEEGTAPHEVEVKVDGLTFVGWTDELGNAADAAAPVTEDVTYLAAIYPELTEHSSFLFTDDVGFLRPYEALTADEFVQALEALASSTARLYFPTLPSGTDAITAPQLKAALTRFFPEREVEKAFSMNDGTVTRSQFAIGMCALLGRGDGETVTLAEPKGVPLDIDAKTADFVCLLEASMDHSVDAEGQDWQSVELPTGMEPGFVNLEGWLYYVQEDGYFLRDGTVGTLYFGPDGRYTCGDPELDQIVTDVLAELIRVNPGVEGVDLLRKAYEYVRDSFTYLRKSPYEMGATGWEIEDAKTMFKDTRGNCYYFAGAFWALARGLGYDARAISGTCTGTDQPHAWVIIAFDGEDYFFDPQWENNYHTRNIYDKDMFMLSLDRVWWWGYKWYH